MCASASLANPTGVLNPIIEPVAPPPPALPPVVSAATAIQRLHSFRIIPAREAVEQLAVWQESSRILLLYRRYFPQSFARSTASTLMPIHHNEHGYSEQELEFFTLVDQHLFPLPEMMFDEERLSSIPIYPQGVDWEDERENMRLSLRVAMALVSDDDTMLWEAWLPQHLRPESGERDWDRFAELCRMAKGLAARFPLLLGLVALDTGNMWLDTTWETSWEEYPWEETAMEYLRKEWRKAQRIFAQLNPLLGQMDKHPRYWLKRLVKLWNSALKVPATAR
jgi:hypothetical protein